MLASEKKLSPESGSGPRGSAKQLDHGHRWLVPVEKLALRVKHSLSVPLTSAPVQKLNILWMSTDHECRWLAEGLAETPRLINTRSVDTNLGLSVAG